MAETLTNTNGSVVLKQSTSFIRAFWFGTTGQTVTVAISKNGGSFSNAGGTVSEIANGWYSVGLLTTDTNTSGILAYHCTASSGGPVDFCDIVQAQIFTDLSINANGQVFIASNIKQNQALTLMFTMTVSGVPTAGLTVTGQRNFGSGFSTIAGAITDLTGGDYKAALTASDINSGSCLYRFTAPGADDRNIVIFPDP